MIITSTSIIKKGEVKTDKHSYQIEYSSTNGFLGRVYANVFEKETGGGEIDPYLGSISYENGTISCSLSATARMITHFEAFEGFLSEIKKEISGE